MCCFAVASGASVIISVSGSICVARLVTICPLTDTHPCLIYSSDLRREAMPCWERYFWMRITLILHTTSIRACTSMLNRSFIINPQGEIVSKYDKIHMFDIFLNGEEHFESKTIDFGNKAVLVNTDFCKIGHSICYDIRFPNLYRKLSQAGAEILVVPAAFTKATGSAHWHVLNRSRAIENVSYVIAPCAIGKIEGGGESYGHSLIIDPWGKIIKDCGNKRGIITASIDISLVKKYRKQLPSLEHDKSFKVKEVK